MNTPNLNYIQQLASGDEEFENTLKSILKKEYPVEVMKYQQLSKEQDFKGLAEIVHKIKHKINILGLEQDTILASNFEKELKQKKLSLQKDFDEVLSKISIFLDEI